MRLFVSYSRADCHLVDKLVPLLNELYGPENAWLDQNLTGGQEWWQKILRQIDRCDIFIYLLSNRSLGSPYCKAEYREAQRLGKPILPVQIRRRIKFPSDLHELKDKLHFVDLSKGPKDSWGMTKLYKSIDTLSQTPPSTSPQRILTKPTPLPKFHLEREPVRIPDVPPGWATIISGVAGGLFGVFAITIVIAVGNSDGGIPAPPAHATALSTPAEIVVAATTSKPPTLEPTLPLAYAAALAGVARNADWTPYTEIINGVEMALVPAGCFQMGSNDGDSDEQPVHEVCFDQPFWIDVYEVTNGQYGEAASNCTQYSSAQNQPRVCIDWFDSKAHCESRGARLPTEAEWEYAARGPDGLVYPWGNAFDGSLLNFCDRNCEYSWADKTADDGYKYTAPVGSYPGGISWVGAYDLSGNVWEWANDWFGSYASGRQVNPTGPGSGDCRVWRGGSWLSDDNFVRAAHRLWSDPDGADHYYGFRCALSYQP